MRLIRLEDQNGIRLRIEGDVDIRSVAELRAALWDAFAADSIIGLDASGVNACDTAGLQLLHSALHSRAKNTSRVSLLGVSSAVTEAGEAIGMELREDSPDGI